MTRLDNQCPLAEAVVPLILFHLFCDLRLQGVHRGRLGSFLKGGDRVIKLDFGVGLPTSCFEHYFEGWIM